ncbi:Fc.00g054420.m01.CDS01 [Cosmosporella sp. VM-42]
MPSSQALHSTYLLVKSFLLGANFHYYILHPPFFLQQYNQWWAARLGRRSLSPELTCLIIRVCSCSLQYLEALTVQKLELEMGEPVQNLTERYHGAAQHLAQHIPPGNGGLCHVQQLLLASSWFKSEVKFVDSWHMLAAAVREAQEIGMHDSASQSGMTQFEQEMRRRVWCILYVWDWQMSTKLSRPRIINTKDSPSKPPSMLLEEIAPGATIPSPITQMAMHYDLIQRLSNRFDVTADMLPPVKIVAYRDEIMAWMSSFPPVFRIVDPDKQFDLAHPWVVLQRAQLCATSYAMMLHPLKPYLTRRLGASATFAAMELRSAAVDCCLSLMEAIQGFFEVLFPLYTKLHFIVFGVFDIGAALCSAITHDDTQSLHRRDAILAAIGSATGILRRIHGATGSGITPYSVLTRFISSLPLSAAESTSLGLAPRKNAKVRSSTGPDLGVSEGSDQTAKPAMLPKNCKEGPRPTDSQASNMSLSSEQLIPDETLLDADFGKFDSLLDWESLELGQQMQADLWNFVA